MRSPIRHYLSSRLFLAILASGLIVGAGSVIAGITLFRGYMERAVAASRAEAANRLKLFDLVIARIVREAEERGHAALKALALRYPDRRVAGAASLAALRRDAGELGVDEIYFIGPDGKVFATSFPPDAGLDLFSFGASFTGFLKGIFGSGRIVDQGVTGSTQTGDINVYQYYNPPGRDFLIEVSTRMRSMVGAAFPGLDYKDLAETLFGVGPRGPAESPVRIMDFLTGTGSSMVYERGPDEAIARRIAASPGGGGGLSWREGAYRMALERLEITVFDSRETYYVLLRIDESYYSGFVAVSLAVAILAIGGASAASFAGAWKTLGPMVASRLERLATAMERVGGGEAAETLDDGVGDELSTIGRGAAEMVATIRRDTEELRLLARRLEEEIVERGRKEVELESTLERNRVLLREVNHRVKNNLQLMGSLARLESGSGESEVAARALRKMEMRIQALALAQDRAGADPSSRGIEMGPVLEELMQLVLQTFSDAAARVQCTIRAPGVALGADDATALLLAAAELADNALRHAFGESRGGSFELSLVRGEDGLCVLEASDDGPGSAGADEGLGLAIVRALAGQRHGTVELGVPATGRGFLARMTFHSTV